MRSVHADDLDTMDDDRLRDEGDVWDSHGGPRPELRKHRTMKTIDELVANHRAVENRSPNHPMPTPESGGAAAPSSSKAFQLLRDYEMATSILESRNRADFARRRPHVAFDHQKIRLDKAFRTAPGGTKLMLDPVAEEGVGRRVMRSSSTAFLSKDWSLTSSSSGNDSSNGRDLDSGSGSGKKKKTVSFQDEAAGHHAVLSSSLTSAAARRQQEHRMDHSRCDDDETGTGNGHVVSPIHAACYKGDPVVVSHLLGHYGAHEATKFVNTPCTCGMTPLQVACDQGHAKIAKLLLRRQARVNKRASGSRSSNCSSPVMDSSSAPPAGFLSAGVGKKRHRSCVALACSRRCVEVVELLLDHGAHVDEDALVTACSVGDAAVVKLLMQSTKKSSSTTRTLTSGFEKLWTKNNSPSSSGSSAQLSGSGIRESGDINPSWISNAAAIAVVNEQLHVLSTLLGDGHSTISRQRVAACAMDAAGTADYKLLRCLAKLYDHALFVSARDAHANSLLHVAVKQASAKCVMLLIRLGLDVNARDAAGITPLYMACARGQSSIVKLLVHAGALCEKMGPNDETPLHLAAQENHLSCVQLLLTHGHAQVDAATLDKCTPLHLACQRGNTQVAKCLLDHGADINAKTVCDETPLLKASRMSNMETVKLLLARDAEVASSSTSSIESCHSTNRTDDDDAVALTASTSGSSVFSTTHSTHSTGRRSVWASGERHVVSGSSRHRPASSNGGSSSSSDDDIFIAKSSTHTSFKGWLKSVVKNK